MKVLFNDNGSGIEYANITGNDAVVPTTRMIFNGMARARAIVKLQARMLAYDTLHRTHYRKLRNAVAARQRNEAFEASIGLVRSK